MLELVHRKPQSLEYKPQKIGNNEKPAKSEKAISEDSSKDSPNERKKRKRGKKDKKRETTAMSRGSDID